MDDFVIVTKNLTKRFGEKIALNALDLTVRRGEIYGFIGRNGAGKTTAMKLILNLLNPDEGDVFLFGEKVNRDSLKKVGSLIEAPGLFAGCSAYENLKRIAILTGADDKTIPGLLELVGLTDVGNKKVRGFSLGMKQRLGIAVALMGEPEILILDEPVNGLDPQGMKEIRELIVKINREKNVTVLISSHMLFELEKIATTYGIIENGTLIEQISAQELESRCAKNLEIVCDDAEKASSVIFEKFGVSPTVNENVLNVPRLAERAAEVNRTLIENDVNVSELKATGLDFESYFIQRTGETHE